jgi:ketosteroid isomerase-like protein
VDDRHAIIDTLARYAWGYDDGDFALLADTFTEDASTGGKVANTDIGWGPVVGRAQIAQMLADIRGEQHDQRRHTLHTHRFHHQDASTADVSVYLSLFATQNQRTRLVTTGWYRAALVKEPDGNWRMRTLEASLDSPF